MRTLLRAFWYTLADTVIVAASVYGLVALTLVARQFGLAWIPLSFAAVAVAAVAFTYAYPEAVRDEHRRRS